MNNLQQELCNNPEVTQILNDNTLDELYVPPATGGGDDDDGNTVVPNYWSIYLPSLYPLLTFWQKSN
ncbi:MAG: hypothetical protein QNJ41_29380 [Xenococcaceae cyanobacterium MO_188.B32]|nr:hypothetical protein [Xenococcaceae cyanobacterium MO_188.B32]